MTTTTSNTEVRIINGREFRVHHIPAGVAPQAPLHLAWEPDRAARNAELERIWRENDLSAQRREAEWAHPVHEVPDYATWEDEFL